MRTHPRLRQQDILPSRFCLSRAAPLLAGHGGTIADLHGVRYEQWFASAAAGLRVLQERCDEVFVCGFSLGGLLALRLAADGEGTRGGAQLAGLIALAPALILQGGRLLHIAGVLKHIKPWYYPLARADFSNPEVRAAVRQHAPNADLDDPAVVEQVRQAAKVPVGSLYELARLQSRVRRDLPRVTLPTLVMQGRLDSTVDPRSAAEVVKKIASPDQRLVWFEHSGHQLPNEAEREQVWATAIEWLDQHRQSESMRDHTEEQIG
jgi:carboxylesterase